MTGLQFSGGPFFFPGFGRGTNNPFFISFGYFPVFATMLSSLAISSIILWFPYLISSAFTLSIPQLLLFFIDLTASLTSFSLKGTVILSGFMCGISVAFSLLKTFEKCSVNILIQSSSFVVNPSFPCRTSFCFGLSDCRNCLALNILLESFDIDSMFSISESILFDSNSSNLWCIFFRILFLSHFIFRLSSLFLAESALFLNSFCFFDNSCISLSLDFFWCFNSFSVGLLISSAALILAITILFHIPCGSVSSLSSISLSDFSLS